MAAISQTTFSNAYSWMKIIVFKKISTEVYSQGSNWQQPSTGLDNGLVPIWHQAIIWTIADPIYWCI